MFKLLTPMVLVVMLTFVHPAAMAKQESSPQVTVSNMQWEPYYYREAGSFKGFAWDITNAVTNQAGVNATYILETWDNVFEKGLRQSNYVISGLGRTAERENMFYWIGPINKELQIYIYKLRSNPSTLDELNDLANFRTAVEQYTYYHDFMIKHGFTDSTLPVANVQSLFSLLAKNRIDFILMEEERLQIEAHGVNFDVTSLEKLSLAFSAQSYMALSKKSPENLYHALKTAYDSLSAQGKIYLH